MEPAPGAPGGACGGAAESAASRVVLIGVDVITAPAGAASASEISVGGSTAAILFNAARCGPE